MVKLEEVVDEDLQKSQEGPTGGEEDWEDSEDGTSTLLTSDDDDNRDKKLAELRRRQLTELDDEVEQCRRDLSALLTSLGFAGHSRSPSPTRSSLTVRNWTDNDFKDMDTDSDADSSVASEASDDGPVDETLLERISALRDIIPPSTRVSISHTFTSAYGYASTGLSWGGKALWVIGTSALLLGVPWALAYAEEQQYLEMEREMKMQQQTSELLTPGASTQPIQTPGTRPAL
jgi:mitochondrial import receptor subunit TOM22